uniref:E4 protein n=1 Tax=Human papillomavirus TaxID=10566 RepID=A0A385PNZ1_9PAPI|nr:MAG: E4 protein [Human papillomavirus]
MVPQENGLYIIKIKLFLLLLLALLKPRSPDLFKGPPGELSAPPGTPYPSRKHLDDKKAKREELARPPQRHLRYDDDEEDPQSNKENLPPPDRSDADWRKTLLQSLLDKLAADILRCQEDILQDLNDLKQRLRIPL